ncbi:MAG: F0F1 ATP synthase subunit A [Paludibacteraceae bacterium]|nr:F0F1 ATP synthase subunit A [Paludibacteraceae bacterium]
MTSCLAKVFFAALFLFSSFSMSAQSSEATEVANEVAAAEKHQEKEGVDLKEMIFGHTGDAYSWHITTVNGHPISIPLLCILYGQNGLDVFCSSNLGHEGHYTEYKGYKIAEEGNDAGKIIELSTGKRPWDFSITKNVASLLISCALLLWIFLSIAKRYKENPMSRPVGKQALLEPLIVSLVDDIIKPSIGKNYKRYTAYLLTAFFFIFLNNILGIIPIFPGGANLTGNIAVTVVLASLTFILTNFTATKAYYKEIFWPEVPIFLKLPIPLMQFIEIMGVFIKPIALCVRLFANMFAGHTMVLILIGLIFIFGQMHVAAGAGISVLSVLLIVFMSLLECLVCFIQAYVFTMLSAIFIGMGQVEEHEH